MTIFDSIFASPSATAHAYSQAMKIASDIGDAWSEVYGKRKVTPSWEVMEAHLNSRVLTLLKCIEASIAKYGGQGGSCCGDKVLHA